MPQVILRSAKPLDMLTVLCMLETESGTPTFELHKSAKAPYESGPPPSPLNVSEVSNG